LDVGAGSGLISLMVAQRSEAIIDAIDIEESAFIQASENIERSIFRDRIRTFYSAFNEYVETRPKPYDLIVSNPPYFVNSLQSPDQKKNLARHIQTLTLHTLLADSRRVLTDDGVIALIIPSEQESELTKQASLQGLSFMRKTHVIPTVGGVCKRLLAELTPCPVSCVEDELTIEITRHQYTEQYVDLTKDFYLKM
jgi:tRNA1Val (adenine37-N6)-methyltransferase